MNVNLDKTEIVVFGKRRWLNDGSVSWSYRDQPIRVSDEFKYLGIILHSTKGVQASVNALATAGSKASFTLDGKFRDSGMMDIVLKLRMFDTVVSPILTYCAEIWGPDMLDTCSRIETCFNNPLEQVHTAFLRRLGRIPSSASRVIVMAQ